MSVRRLADDSIQPATFAFSDENQRWAERKMAEYPPGRQQSAVIPLLMRAQDQEGWVTRAAIEEIASMLDMAYIRVLEVATFYTQYQLQPVGTRAHILVCGTTPCMLRGAEQLREVCERRIHPDPHHTNADGTMSWEEVECVGACVNAPVVMIGEDAYEDLTPERFEEIVEAFADGNGGSIPAGPQIERRYAAAAGGQTTLLEAPSATRTYKPFPPPPEVQAAAPEKPTAKPAAARPASEPKPTKPGRGDGDVPEEAAPALKQPAGAPKASFAEAESERAEFTADHDADGEPNSAMREDATGAESDAGKVDAGKAPGKQKRAAPGAGAGSAGTDAQPPDPGGQAGKPDKSGVSPTRDSAGRKPDEPQGEE